MCGCSPTYQMCDPACCISNSFPLCRSHCNAFSSSEQKEPDGLVLASTGVQLMKFSVFQLFLQPSIAQVRNRNSDRRLRFPNAKLYLDVLSCSPIIPVSMGFNICQWSRNFLATSKSRGSSKSCSAITYLASRASGTNPFPPYMRDFR